MSLCMMHAGYVCCFSYIMLSIFPNNHQIEKRLLRYMRVACHVSVMLSQLYILFSILPLYLL